MHFPLLQDDEVFDQSLVHVHLRGETNLTAFSIKNDVADLIPIFVKLGDRGLHRFG